MLKRLILLLISVLRIEKRETLPQPLYDIATSVVRFGEKRVWNGQLIIELFIDLNIIYLPEPKILLKSFFVSFFLYFFYLEWRVLSN